MTLVLRKLSMPTFGEVLEARERLANGNADTIPYQSAKPFDRLVLGLVCIHKWNWHAGNIFQCEYCGAYPHN